MAQEWYYAQGDHKFGPISVKELKQAVTDGSLQPTDLVWTDGMKEWKEARVIKGLAGLWPTSPPVVAAAPPPLLARRATPVAKPVADPSSTEVATQATSPESVVQHWWLIGLTLLCCFPVGLVFVWMHPRLTKSTKWTISGVVGVLFIVMMISSQRSTKSNYTLLELREMFPVGTPSKQVYNTLGNPDRHDRGGIHSISSYKKLCNDRVVMFVFEDGVLVDIDTFP
jgi:hypothetical protein